MGRRGRRSPAGRRTRLGWQRSLLRDPPSPPRPPFGTHVSRVAAAPLPAAIAALGSIRSSAAPVVPAAVGRLDLAEPVVVLHHDLASDTRACRSAGVVRLPRRRPVPVVVELTAWSRRRTEIEVRLPALRPDHGAYTVAHALADRLRREVESARPDASRTAC